MMSPIMCYAYWIILKNHVVTVPICWWKHHTQKCTIIGNDTVVWDKTQVMDKPIKTIRPDIIPSKGKKLIFLLIDISVLLDINIGSKAADKHTKYCDLEIVLEKN
eukprot:6034718-Ditylum_brightwellii.AAC.1